MAWDLPFEGKWIGVLNAWIPDGELRMSDQFQGLGMGEQRVPGEFRLLKCPRVARTFESSAEP